MCYLPKLTKEDGKEIKKLGVAMQRRLELSKLKKYRKKAKCNENKHRRNR